MLVIDVARNKYPPFWVSIHALYEALNTVDDSTNKTRGYVVATRPPPGVHTRHHSVADQIRRARKTLRADAKELSNRYSSEELALVQASNPPEAVVMARRAEQDRVERITKGLSELFEPARLTL